MKPLVSDQGWGTDSQEDGQLQKWPRLVGSALNISQQKLPNAPIPPEELLRSLAHSRKGDPCYHCHPGCQCLMKQLQGLGSAERLGLCLSILMLGAAPCQHSHHEDAELGLPWAWLSGEPGALDVGSKNKGRRDFCLKYLTY